MEREKERRTDIEWAKLRARRLIAACVPLLVSSAPEVVLAGGDLPPGAASCLECHGKAGHGDETLPPALANLTADDIASALAAYRSGQRNGTIMPRIAPGFTEAESRAIAAALGRPGHER